MDIELYVLLTLAYDYTKDCSNQSHETRVYINQGIRKYFIDRGYVWNNGEWESALFRQKREEDRKNTSRM